MQYVWHVALEKQGLIWSPRTRQSIHKVPIFATTFGSRFFRLILFLLLGCHRVPWCLDSSLGQDDDSHILLTAGLEAPLKQEVLILNLNNALDQKLKSTCVVLVILCCGVQIHNKQFCQPRSLTWIKCEQEIMLKNLENTQEMYPTSTPASLLEERERSVCNMHSKVRLPTNYSVFNLIFIPWSIALWSLPWDPFRPVYPIETAEATLLSIFLPILLHYIPARHLRKI